jgi:predicted esterase
VEDWLAVAGAARAASPLLTGPLGYAGFSMGALFGLSIVADLPDVRAAVFALGGTLGDGAFAPRGPGARNARVHEGASHLGEREVLMLNMTRDEHFPIEGAIAAFEVIPGPKRMGVWAGTHEEIPPEAIVLANQFFARTLA